MLFSEDPEKLKAFLDRLNDAGCMHGMRFEFQKCTLLAQDWINSKEFIGFTGGNGGK